MPKQTPRQKPNETTPGAGSALPDNELYGTIFDPHISGETKVKLYRRNDTTGAFDPHGVVSLENATDEFVESLFGGGLFKLQLFIRDPKGFWKQDKQRQVNIPGPYRPPRGALPNMGTEGGHTAAAPAAAVLAPVAAPSTGFDMNKIAESMAFKAMMDNFSRQPPAPVAPSDNGMTAIVGSMITMMGGLITTLLTKEDPASKMMVTTLEAMKASMDRLAQPAPASVLGLSSPDILNAVKEFNKLREAIGGGTDEGGGGGDGWKSLDKVLTIVAAKMGGPGGPPQAPDAPQGQLTVGVVMDWKAFLRKNAGVIMDAVQMGMDPGRAAEFVWDWAGNSDAFFSLLELLKTDTAAEQILTEMPTLQPYRKWVDVLVEKLKAEADYYAKAQTDTVE